MIEKIISNGDIGVSRAALDAAIHLDIERGGWAVSTSQDGSEGLDAAYGLQPLPAGEPMDAARRNVLESDGTLLVAPGLLTDRLETVKDIAEELKRPWHHLDLQGGTAFQSAMDLNTWVLEETIKTLHVTGSRAGDESGVYLQTVQILETLFYLNLMESGREAASGGAAFPLPASLSEAVEILVSNMPLKDRTTIANMTAGELPALDWTLGEYIRKQFGIWSGNAPLLNSCRKEAKKTDIEMDDAAAVIIRRLWENLKETHVLRVVK